jgi:hypothetical protein
MKKLLARAAAVALVASGAWCEAGEAHETLKAHTLETSVGNISFGAWGRSTFNIGREMSSTKITATSTAKGEVAVSAGTSAITAYEAGKLNTSAFSAYQTAATAAGLSLGSVTLAEDGSNLEEYATAVGTYATVVGVSNGSVSLSDAQAYGTQVGQAAAGAVITKMLKEQEKDESSSRGYAELAPDWSYGSRVGFWIVGRTPDEKFGFDLNLDADARSLFVHKLWDSNESSDKTNYNEDGKYAVAIGDQAKIWGKFDLPLDLQSKIAFGRMRENELRGSIGDFGQRESSYVKSEDDIFQEIWTATGLFADLRAGEDSVLKGLYVNGAIDIAGTLGGESATDADSDKSVSFYKAMRNAQAGIGYTIPSLLQVKAQYWGDSIDESNYRYEVSKYADARTAGFGMNDYYGRMEVGIDYLGNMGGAKSFNDPAFDRHANPNANLIELGFKVPIVTDKDLRDYDPEKFYNWYSCLGTMGIVKEGGLLYKAHVWGGQGTSNLKQYSYGLVNMSKGDGANIIMAGVDALAEVCANGYGKQDVFIGLSAAYNITNASAEGNMKSGLSVSDLSLQQHNIAAEVYVKKTFAANNYMFTGVAGNWTIQSMKGCVNDIVDLEYTGKSSKFYMPIGVEMFF